MVNLTVTQSAFRRVNMTIRLIRKVQTNLLRKSLITIYKSFTRPHLDYGDVVYDWASNESLHKSQESIQYSAAVARTGAIRRKSSEKLSQEVGLETIRRWLRKLYLLHKLLKEKSPAYLFQLIPENNSPYTTRSIQKIQIPFFQEENKLFQKLFLSCRYNGVEEDRC